MDGEDLIICVAIRMPNKAQPPLASNDFQVISIASRNRLRFTSFCNALSLDFGVVWEGFGKPRWKPKSIFSIFFSMIYLNTFWHRFRVDF